MRQQWLDVPASELLMLVASSASLSGSSVSSQVASLALMALLLALVALVAFLALMVSFSTGGFHSPGSSVSAKNLVTSILRPRPGISYLEAPHNKRGAWLLNKAPWIGSLFGWGACSGSNQRAARLAQGCPLLCFWWVWWWLDCGWPCLAPLYQSLPLLRGRLWLCLQNTQHVEIYFFFGILLCRVTFGSLHHHPHHYHRKILRKSSVSTSLCSGPRSGWNPAVDPGQKMICRWNDNNGEDFRMKQMRWVASCCFWYWICWTNWISRKR